MRNQTYLTLLCLCLWAGVFAQTTINTGPNGGEWSDPANWQNNVLPGPGNDAQISDGTLYADAGTILTKGSFENAQVLDTQSLNVLSGSTFSNNFGANLNIN